MASTYIFIYIYIYKYIYIYINIYIYTYIYIYAISRIHEKDFQIRLVYTNKKDLPFDELLTTNYFFL